MNILNTLWQICHKETLTQVQEVAEEIPSDENPPNKQQNENPGSRKERDSSAEKVPDNLCREPLPPNKQQNGNHGSSKEQRDSSPEEVPDNLCREPLPPNKQQNGNPGSSKEQCDSSPEEVPRKQHCHSSPEPQKITRSSTSTGRETSKKAAKRSHYKAKKCPLCGSINVHMRRHLITMHSKINERIPISQVEALVQASKHGRDTTGRKAVFKNKKGNVTIY